MRTLSRQGTLAAESFGLHPEQLMVTVIAPKGTPTWSV